MKLRELFPEAIVNQTPSMGPDWLSVDWEGEFLHFPVDSLSQRERFLLQLKKDEAEDGDQPDNPWFRYLLQKKGPLPQRLQAAQLVYIEHPYRLSADLLELFASLLPNLRAVFAIGSSRSLLLLDQEQVFEVTDLIQDLLPTIENDFGTKLTVFFGNIWTRLQQDDLQDYFDSENNLFTDFLRHKGSESSISFAQMILWARSRQLDMGIIPAKLAYFIEESKDMVDIITAMWDCQGNLVQTAQKLFMHRNSLQYKLEKFHALSGLNLKNLDDLAFSYLSLLVAD